MPSSGRATPPWRNRGFATQIKRWNPPNRCLFGGLPNKCCGFSSAMLISLCHRVGRAREAGLNSMSEAELRVTCERLERSCQERAVSGWGRGRERGGGLFGISSPKTKKHGGVEGRRWSTLRFGPTFLSWARDQKSRAQC